MKSNELRIGNLINYEQTTHIVDGTDNPFIKSYWITDEERKDDYFHHEDQADPILLTEDWLKKFGWNKKDNAWYDKHLGLMLIGKAPHFRLFSIGETGGEWFIKNVSYVHKLQNIYFEMEDEELTIKQL